MPPFGIPAFSGPQTPMMSPMSPTSAPPSAIPPIKSLQTALERAISVLKGGTPKAQSVLQLLQSVRTAAKSIFGENSLLTQQLIAEMKAVSKQPSAKADWGEILALKLLHTERLFEQLTLLANAGHTGARSYSSAIPSTKKVFIVHGHDELNWRRLHALLIEPPYKAHAIEPTVIREQAGQTKPILQKFEDAAAEACFAIAIFTPDDMVRVKNSGSQLEQARPNVIFETGWFVGRLGPSRVLLLVKQGTQLHSDFDGVSRISFSESVEESMAQINRELVVAGLVG